MKRIINNIKNHSNWFNYFTYKYVNKQAKHFTFKLRNGIEVNVPKRMMHTYKECFFDQTYLKGFPAEKVPGKFENVIDIGANVGYFSLFMLSRNKKANIYAFEPMPRNFGLLQQYKTDNNLTNFHAFNKAVADESIKELVLNYDDSDQFTTSATMFSDSKQQNQLRVPTTSLENIIKDNNLSHVDFVKIDCEGAEYSILYNTPEQVFNKIGMMSIETHPGKEKNENLESLTAYIRDKNYKTKIQGDIIWAWR